MKRIEGYIDLFDLLGIKNPDKFLTPEELMRYILENNKTVIVRKIVDRRKFIFSFEYNKETYYFKFDSLPNPYTELIIEEICHDLDIPCLSYDIARIGFYEGNLSKNYKVKDAKYIPGLKILKDCYQSEMDDYYNQNTLYGIWHALEHRYKSRKNMPEIVSSLMEKIVKIFLLDILTGQSDRHAENWEIIEYSDETIDLVAVFDNGRSMLNAPFMTVVSLGVDYSDKETNIALNRNFLENELIEFQSISSSEFASIFPSWLWVISEENVKRIFNQIEKKTGYPMPEETKKEFLDKFKFYEDYFLDDLEINPSSGRK